MARYYNRRRFARRVRRVRRSKRSALSRVKKDIMKCNFPTKVKFMGLTERKVMFLTEYVNMTTTGGKEIILNPLNASNIDSIMNSVAKQIMTGGTVQNPVLTAYNVNYSNWDKMCILGIYIKVQPIKNMWDGQHGDITPVKCIYSQNTLDLNNYRTFVQVAQGNQQQWVPGPVYGPLNYDNDSLPFKQVFTFNSNESFTIYIPAPPTMSSLDPCVHKSKTWWSLVNIRKNLNGDIYVNNIENDEEESQFKTYGEDDDDDEEDMSIVGSGPVQPQAAGGDNRSYIHAGRLYFVSTAAAAFNVTINYKVALKG